MKPIGHDPNAVEDHANNNSGPKLPPPKKNFTFDDKQAMESHLSNYQFLIVHLMLV